MLDKLKGLGNMASMLRQAEEFKEALKGLQTELQDMQIVVDSDDHLVKVTVNGQAKILALTIDQ
ncbi:MAG: YbaB/EbfC family nucleoid-associated protein, partial [Rhodobacteraceae bacterium]|nr:YbaB/EbfC family nucleoid-associated protein [Paracoccaceae bacterium]